MCCLAGSSSTRCSSRSIPLGVAMCCHNYIPHIPLPTCIVHIWICLNAILYHFWPLIKTCSGKAAKPARLGILLCLLMHAHQGCCHTAKKLLHQPPTPPPPSLASSSLLHCSLLIDHTDVILHYCTTAGSKQPSGCPCVPPPPPSSRVDDHSQANPCAFVRHHCLQGGLWWATAETGQQGVVSRLLRALALVGTLVGLEGRVLLPAFGHYLGLHYPWNYITISAALFGAGSLLLLHFEGQSPGLQCCLPCPGQEASLCPHPMPCSCCSDSLLGCKITIHLVG